MKGGENMGIINMHKTGLAVGALLGLWHAVWSLLVAVGWAQSVINFIFDLHFIQPPYTILPFKFWTALGLVVVTAVVGYVFGWVFAKIWNWLQAK